MSRRVSDDSVDSDGSSEVVASQGYLPVRDLSTCIADVVLLSTQVPELHMYLGVLLAIFWRLDI